jgi:hypothetical protein
MPIAINELEVAWARKGESSGRNMPMAIVMILRWNGGKMGYSQQGNHFNWVKLQIDYTQQLCCMRGNAGAFLFSIAVEWQCICDVSMPMAIILLDNNDEDGNKSSDNAIYDNNKISQQSNSKVMTMTDGTESKDTTINDETENTTITYYKLRCGRWLGN